MKNKKKKNELTILIGKRISLLRKSLGLSQQDIEDKSSLINGEKSVKYRTLSLIEQGYGEPKITTLYEISKTLNISLAYLLDISQENEATDVQMKSVEIFQRMDNKTQEIALKILSALIKDKY